MTTSPKIAVVGCGALGGFYGARLARDGHDVHFLLRSDFEAVRTHGVRIRDSQGGFVVRPRAARASEEVGTCDLVLIGLKTTANRELAWMLPPLVGPETVVLTLQNGLGNEEAIAEVVAADRILGGMCFVCLNRVAPGEVVHLAHGRIVLGEYRGPVTERTRQMADWFRRAGVPCDLTDNLERAHWEKLVWNIPFNGLGVAAVAGIESVRAGRRLDGGRLGPCASTEVLLNDAGWLALLRELMAETIAAARALGLEVPESAAETQIARTREMGPYRASTLIDFERGLPLELESLFGEPLRRAQAHGVPTPVLSGLYHLLKELDPASGRSQGTKGS